MTINLKIPGALTIPAVRDLLAPVSDTEDHQLRVDTNGIVDIYPASQPASANTLFQVEIWLKGNGYVGHKAVQDASWVERVYNVLDTNWPIPTSIYIDLF